MNLLMVDDEVLAVDALLLNIPWQQLGILNIFKAYNIDDAMVVLQREIVDILLCDIEMPMGNGIELLKRMRSLGLETETIILTCHAEFGYAREALKLGCGNYLLKPVAYDELAAAVMAAKESVTQKKMDELYHTYGHQWVLHRDKLEEQLWRDLLSSDNEDYLKQLVMQSKRLELAISWELNYALVLFAVKYAPESLNYPEGSLIDFSLKNIAGEMFSFDQTVFIKLSVNYYALVIPEAQLNETLIQDECYRYMQIIHEYFHYRLAAYYHPAAPAGALSKNLSELMDKDQKNVLAEIAVYMYIPAGGYEQHYRPPKLTLWAALLMDERYLELMTEIRKYLAQEKSHLNRFNLVQLVQDFEQIGYKVMTEKHLPFGQYSDLTGNQLYQQRLRSVDDFLAWVDYTFKALGAVRPPKSVGEKAVKQVKNYINAHIGEDISREELAAGVYLNADYLNRIFKKETGCSLKEYINQQKMEVARELLTVTDMPVNEVSIQVGFYNFSYFSTCFKKITGMSPGIWRQKYQLPQ